MGGIGLGSTNPHTHTHIHTHIHIRTQIHTYEIIHLNNIYICTQNAHRTHTERTQNAHRTHTHRTEHKIQQYAAHRTAHRHLNREHNTNTISGYYAAQDNTEHSGYSGHRPDTEQCTQLSYI